MDSDLAKDNVNGYEVNINDPKELIEYIRLVENEI